MKKPKEVYLEPDTPSRKAWRKTEVYAIIMARIHFGYMDDELERRVIRWRKKQNEKTTQTPLS